MGNCLGKGKGKGKGKSRVKGQPRLSPRRAKLQAPPHAAEESVSSKAVSDRDPPPAEEETVKEVLSETPVSPLPLPPPTVSVLEDPKNGVRKPEEGEEEEQEKEVTHTKPAVTRNDDDDDDDGHVDVSRRCGSGQKVMWGPDRKIVSTRLLPREERRVRSPSGRRPATPSPEKRNPLISRVPARRRSASPCGTGRHATGDGCSWRGEASQRARAVPAQSAVEKCTAAQGQGGEEVEGTKESLENPLVSLECFIFL